MKLFLIISLLFSYSIQAAVKSSERVKYKTSFGECPVKSAGDFSLQLMEKFNETKSLKEVKLLISENKLDSKYFVSSYKIDFEPLKNIVRIDLECPKAILKLKVLRPNGEEFYTAIMSNEGEVLDPNYEVLLRSEKKLLGKIPVLILPVELIENKNFKKILSLMETIDPVFLNKVSEMVIDSELNLTIIASFKRSSSTIFMGNIYWEDKMKKLTRVLNYMESKNKVPTIINLTNLKKIVVKF